MRRLAGFLVAAGLLAAGTACGGGDASGDRAGEGQQIGGTEALTARTLGTAYLEDGDLEAAEEQFRRLVELAPESPSGYASLARVALQRGDPGAAREWARKALDRAPGSAAAELRLLVATSHAEEGDSARARELLRSLVEDDADDPRALWELSRLAGGEQRAELLGRLVEEDGSNVAARTELAAAQLDVGRPSRAAAQLEALRQVAPELPGDADRAFRRALEAARAGRTDEARRAVVRFRERYGLTPAYQAALNRLRGPRGVRPGTAELSFAAGGAGMPGRPGRVRLAPVTETVGLSGATGGTVAAGDADGDRSPDLLVGARIYRNEGGAFRPSGAPAPGAPGSLSRGRFADLDNDGRLEVVLAGPDAIRLYGLADGVPRAAADSVLPAALPVPEGARPGDVRTLDLDQDGDLDVFVAARGRNLAYRNDGDGTFTELAAEMGLAGPGAGAAPDAEFLDAEGDGFLDLAVTAPGGSVLLYANRGHGRFESREVLAGDGSAGRAALATGDVDHDGLPELLVAREDGSVVRLENGGEGRFGPGEPVAGAAGGGAPLSPEELVLADLDNDGWTDLIHAGERGSGGSGPGLAVYRGAGDGTFQATPDLVAGELPDEVTAVAAEDYDGDGDLDLALGGPAGVAYLRNDGGNARNYLRLRLVGLRDGSGKNNHFGIGARVEVRAGDLYQMRTVEEAVTHIGLADRRRADVVRIVWPNGVPQVMYEAGAGATATEEQQLKGSCAFLYAWDGEGFRMVTDVMWRSALGMPLGIMAGPEGGRPSEAPASPVRYASPAASREYVRIPPGALRERAGAYQLRFTEELWEVAYADELRLVAVDHPDSVDVLVDEAFRPSDSPPNDELHRLAGLRPPVAATDGEGHDLLPALRASDDVHVDDLEPTRYQGLVEMHEIVLRAGAVGPDEPLHLLLEGWVFPTDASINVAIAQNPELRVVPPVLEVPDGNGGWRPVVPDLSFPAGKEKSLVADLTGLLPPADPRVRVRTTMEVYWDRAAFASGREDVAVRRTAAHPAAAELRYRGFSRQYRKGGRHGPHWFDYGTVSTEPRWSRAITGRYTRYGDVRELLVDADSRTVVMAPGDEIRLRFDAAAFPDLPRGWSRTFLLYSNGWIKDADRNTRRGRTVAPQPVHGLSAYPPPPGQGLPRDSADRAYLREYQTRIVGERPSPLLPGGD